MFCAECGAKNEGAARFCTSCGAKISAASGDASIATPSIAKATEARPRDTSVDETTYKGRVVKKMADGTWMIDGVWSRFERLQLATDYIDGKASEQVTGKVGAANAAVASPLVVSTASRGNPALGVVGVVCLLGVMGYVILSGTIFKGSALESALDPFGGAETEDKWDKLADQGGLKYSNKYFGLNIISVSSLQYSGGRLKFVQFGVDSEHSPAELRSALSKACKMSPDDFKSTMPGTIRAQGIKGNLTCYYEQGRGNRNHMLIMRK